MSKYPRWKTILSRGITQGCVIAVAILLLFFAMIYLIAPKNLTDPGMNGGDMLTIVLFSLFLSFSRELLNLWVHSAVLKEVIRFLLIGIVYFIVILRNRQLALSGAGAYIIWLFIYALVYFLILGIAILIRRRFPHLTGAEAPVEKKPQPPYENRFS